MSESDAFTYEGIDREGVAGVGCFNGTAADIGPFVHRRFGAGWQSLIVSAGDVQVGGIAILEGDRLWWAEDGHV